MVDLKRLLSQQIRPRWTIPTFVSVSVFYGLILLVVLWLLNDSEVGYHARIVLVNLTVSMCIVSAGTTIILAMVTDTVNHFYPNTYTGPDK